MQRQLVSQTLSPQTDGCNETTWSIHCLSYHPQHPVHARKPPSVNGSIKINQLFENFPELRELAGMLFETLGQRILQENISLEMVPMVRLDKVPHGKPQWHSSHIFLSNTILESKRLEALNDRSHLDVKPTRVVQSVIPSPVKEGVYYVPRRQIK